MSRLSKRIARGDFNGDSSDEDEVAMAQMVMASSFQYMQMRHNQQQGGHVGSVSGRAFIRRDRAAANERIHSDYFSEDPLFGGKNFRQRFRMAKPLFERILAQLQQYDDYFVQKSDAVGTAGLSGIQKMTASMRMLAYGMPADSVDEYVKIGKSTAIESLMRFCRGVVEIFEPEYLRAPNEADVSRLLRVAEDRGFPGMLGSLDCMHWQWDKCPTAYHGMYTGHVEKPTIILEAVASYDLWIWHAFFGMPGSFNDINVLDQSHLFDELRAGRAPHVQFVINGHEYDMGYYLADGIYPKWATIVQTIREPSDRKKAHFARMQEAYRKDVERAFGVLQARFAIVKGPARFWDQVDLYYIMKTCVILHNMIIEYQRDEEDVEAAELLRERPLQVSRERTPTFTDFLTRNKKIRSTDMYYQLRNDLVEHLWARQGEEA